MIVRILGEGQYDLDDADEAKLNALDAEVEANLSAGDAEAFSAALQRLVAAVRSLGKGVDDETILPSDLVVPNEDASIDEVRALLDSEDLDR